MQDAGSEAEDLAYARMQMRVRTFSSCYAHTLSFDLEAQTSFVFPQCSCYSGFHARWSDLTCGVVGLWLLIGLSRNTMGCVSMLRMTSGWHCLSLLALSDISSSVNWSHLVGEVTARLTVAPQPEVKSHR